MPTTLEKVRVSVQCNISGRDEKPVKDSDRLRADLGADSLDMVAIEISIETAFAMDFDFDDHLAPNADITVAGLAALIDGLWLRLGLHSGGILRDEALALMRDFIDRRLPRE